MTLYVVEYEHTDADGRRSRHTKTVAASDAKTARATTNHKRYVGWKTGPEKKQSRDRVLKVTRLR